MSRAGTFGDAAGAGDMEGRNTVSARRRGQTVVLSVVGPGVLEGGASTPVQRTSASGLAVGAGIGTGFGLFEAELCGGIAEIGL